MPSMQNHIENLTEGLVFMITILVIPPQESESEAGNELLTRITTFIREVVAFICSLYMDENRKDISKGKEICLSSFKGNIDMASAEIREFIQIPNWLEPNFPTANGIGFIDFLLENLKEMLQCESSSIPFAKHKVETIQQELFSLRDFVKDMMELQNEHEQVKDLWKQIISVHAKLNMLSSLV